MNNDGEIIDKIRLYLKIKNYLRIVENELIELLEEKLRCEKMPIKAENKKLYPKNWKEIRQKILERAGNKCEFCGVENYAVGYRDKDGNFVESVGMQQEADEIDGEKLFKIILTIAHLDHDPTNCDPSNLRALCQKCHNNYDKEHRKQTRRKTLEEKRGQTCLFQCKTI